MNMTDIEAQLQQELFALPIRMKHIATVGDMKLYTSEDLQRKFIEAMSKNSRLASSAGAIKSLVSQQRVIPCYMNKGIFRFLSHKILRSGAAKMIMGFYHSETGKIYMLMDNNVSFMGYGPNAMLADLLIHECMHMFSIQRGRQFLTFFKPELTKYYEALYRQIFQIKTSTKFDVFKVVQWTHKTYESTSSWPSSILITQKKFLMDYFKTYTTLSADQFEAVCLKYVFIVRLGLTEEIDKIVQERDKFQDILGPARNIYKTVFGGATDSFVYQELFIPSEVIGIFSEVDQSSPKPIKAIALIA